MLGQSLYHHRPSFLRRQQQQQHQQPFHSAPLLQQTQSDLESSTGSSSSSAASSASLSLPPNWEEKIDYDIKSFSELPSASFGYNQHIRINEDFKESLRQILWAFRAPIRYAFAYGSGVFSQTPASSSSHDGTLDLDKIDPSPHPNPPSAVADWQKGGGKTIDFIFGVSHTQHWHSLNLAQHPDHYSFLRYSPYASALISSIQDRMGAGVYFHPGITVNGTLIKYGVVNLDTLSLDLSSWSTLYLAGRLQKPVKILRDDPRIRLANQVNLLSALRTALLMLPEKFTERQLYERIAGLSYMGDPRMNALIASENPNKVSNIVGAQLPGFRQLYVPLIDTLPNVAFTDSRTPRQLGWEKTDAIRATGSHASVSDVLGGRDGLSLQQNMDPTKRGNMVRRLPSAFRKKLYAAYSKKLGIPSPLDEDDKDGFKRREGGEFDQRIASQADLSTVMGDCVKATVRWPAATQSLKGVLTAGPGSGWRYWSEKRKKGAQVKKEK